MPCWHHTTASKTNEGVWKGHFEYLEGQTNVTKAKLHKIANPGWAALQQSPVSIDLRHKLAEAFPEKAHNLPPLQKIFHNFFQYAGCHSAEYPDLSEALALHKEATTSYCFTKKDLAATLVGDAAEGQGRQDRNLSANTIKVEKHSKPYSELDWCIAKAEYIYKIQEDLFSQLFQVLYMSSNSAIYQPSSGYGSDCLSTLMVSALRILPRRPWPSAASPTRVAARSFLVK
ncbi:hypothetical protein DFH05DRAFT_1528407 [Lentinula detonsa]|uniref:Uncharacterized protein n=1 Tax=Lentinula detonsa TaxID=2804962 RepID=A0A9W8NVG5_9AGAR|nr:hypothetical protein DFH05DRAFT_1528407 [Lentinula detonsa]